MHNTSMYSTSGELPSSVIMFVWIQLFCHQQQPSSLPAKKPLVSNLLSQAIELEMVTYPIADSNWLMLTCLFTSTRFLMGDGTDLVALLLISVCEISNNSQHHYYH